MEARGRYSTPESKTNRRSQERTQTDLANRIAFQGCTGLRSIRLHKPALERIADSNQFGTVSGSSTVLALLSMIHEWLQATDGNSASVRVFLFDYRKAFDFIDHGTLAAKLKEVEIPNSIVN